MCDAEAAAPVEQVAEPIADAPAKRSIKKQKISLEELEVGSNVEGTIRSVQSYGAFVDLGAATDGLLHISQMANTFVKDANEMFKVGDTVNVRILSIDTQKQQIGLTCKDESAKPERPARKPRSKPDLSEFANADPKEFITGTVNSITSYGAFVTLKEGVDGLVHISAIQEGGVGKVEDVLKEGQEVQVRVVSLDPEKRRISLSMKPWTESGDADAPRRERRSRGDDFGGEDAAWQMSSEELEDLGLDFEEDGDAVSVFAQAFTRAEAKAKAKAEGKKYSFSV